MKFVKVMFLHLSVILFTGGRGWQGVCVAGGVHGRGWRAWQGGMHGGGIHGGGECMAGGMHHRGACVAGGHPWQGGIHGRGAPTQQILRDTVIPSMSGRYASYWNALLFKIFLCWVGTLLLLLLSYIFWLCRRTFYSYQNEKDLNNDFDVIHQSIKS